MDEMDDHSRVWLTLALADEDSLLFDVARADEPFFELVSVLLPAAPDDDESCRLVVLFE